GIVTVQRSDRVLSQENKQVGRCRGRAKWLRELRNECSQIEKRMRIDRQHGFAIPGTTSMPSPAHGSAIGPPATGFPFPSASLLLRARRASPGGRAGSCICRSAIRRDTSAAVHKRWSFPFAGVGNATSHREVSARRRISCPCTYCSKESFS